MRDEHPIEEHAIDERLFQQLLESTGRDTSFLTQVVTAFIEDTREMLVQLEAASAAGDRGSQRRICHSLKSSSLSLGAVHLASLLRALEQKAAGAGGAAEDVTAIAAEFRLVSSELTRRIGASGVAPA